MPISMKLLTPLAVATLLSAASFRSSGQNLIKPPIMQQNWLQDYEPFRLVGNLYYVGTYDLACYLISTSAGHILINTGLPESTDMIRTHVEKLGFKFSDIKVLLATHAHYDHVGSMAAIKQMTGARLMINERDAAVMADGGNSDYAFGGKGSTFAPVKPDVLLSKNDTVRLGEMSVAVLHHPGHTKGASSFSFDVRENNRNYRVVIVNMPTVLDETKLSGMPTYPEVAQDYAYTIDQLKKLNFDLWFSSHAAQFGLHRKRKPGDPYNPLVFDDRKGYDNTIENLNQAYIRRLTQQ
jgi:metallo-beta-lactamase class B